MELGVPLEHVRAAAAGVDLHVVLAGPAGGPPVVLLHGFPEFWYGWRHQIAPLARAGYRVIAPDLRGYNESGKPRGSRNYSPELLQQDVLALLDHFGIGTARIIGHDWGGLLTWWLASRHPGRVQRAVILNAPHPAVFSRALRGSLKQQLRSFYLLLFQFPQLPELLLRSGNYFWLHQALTRPSRRGTFSEMELAHYQRAWSQPGALAGMLAWYRGARRFPLEAGRVEVPVLLIWGDRDIALRPQLADASLDWCDQGRLHRLADAGHWLQHEAAEQVNAQLLEFLAAEQSVPVAL